MISFQTKHERNSAKITTLVVLIIALLLFVVGPNYLEEPEEYGVAINFGEGNFIPNNNQNNTPLAKQTIEEELDEIEDTLEDIEDVEDIEEEEITEEEQIEDEVETEDEDEEKEVETEDTREEELAKEQAEKELLEQQQEEAERLKAEEEAKKREAEAKKKAEKEKAEREAKEEATRKAKVEAERKAREAKQRADKAKREVAAKAEADKKAAAAAAEANKNNGTGGKTTGFSLNEQAPIYPGCEGLDNNARKTCMRDKIAQFVIKNYNNKIAEDLGLTEDQSIKIRFTIDITGKIIGVRALASHPELVEETKRVMSLLPKLKPGMQQGKPKKVPFSVPIKIKME